MSSPSNPRPAGAFPWMGPASTPGFLLHATVALAGLVYLNWMIATRVPFEIKSIGSSYLIFFYHFPAALCSFAFYTGVLVASIAYLVTHRPAWDRRARVACLVGVVVNAALLVTGSVWAKAAWGHWWIWDDKRLMTAAIMALMYLGYLVLQRSIENPERRRTYAAVYGILAFLNIPIVHYAIRLFGEVSHPMRIDSTPAMIQARWFGVGAFLVLYLLLYRWAYDWEELGDRVEAGLDRIRRIEEREVTT